MSRRSGTNRPQWPRILLQPGFWLPFLVAFHILVLLHAAQWYAYAAFAGKASHPWRYLRWSMELWYTRAALAPVAAYAALRYRFNLAKPFRDLLAYSVFTLLLAALVSVLQVAIVGHLGTEKLFSISSAASAGQSSSSLAGEEGPATDHMAPLEEIIVKGWPHLVYNMFTYWMLIGLVLGICYYREAQKSELQGARLQAELATMRLQVLRMQLDPHFLFNTLHAISTLIHEDPAAAEEMLLQLSHLLREILADHQMEEIPLRKELQFTEAYLAIERVRFGDRLSSRISVSAELLDYLVPQLLLQPLVENAIRHGIGKHTGADRIEISAAQCDGFLHLQVRNGNGRLLERQGDVRSGIGLSNTRLRLRTLYNDEASLELENALPTGVCARLRLPLRTGAPTQSRDCEVQFQ